MLEKFKATSAINKAICRYAEGRYEESALLFEKSIALDPAQSRMEYTYLMLGMCRNKTKDDEKAFKHFKKSIDLYLSKGKMITGIHEIGLIKEMLDMYISFFVITEKEKEAEGILDGFNKLGVHVDMKSIKEDKGSVAILG